MPSEYFTSATSWAVPDGINTVTVTAHGGPGEDGQDGDGSGGGSGGNGGEAVAHEIPVNADDTFYIRFQSGNNDGGEGDGNGGRGGNGGVAAIARLNDDSSSGDVVVGGGGGGGGGGGEDTAGGGNGGDGGGPNGGDGQDGSGTTIAGGDGATQSSGVSSFLQHGDNASDTNGSGGGGGGGMGYKRGEGGEAQTDTASRSGGGGGGASSWVDTSVAANESYAGGVESFEASVRIEYAEPPNAPVNQEQTITGADSTTATWTENTSAGDATGYDVEIQEDGNSWARVATDLTSTSYDATFPDSTDEVRVRVRATNSVGASDWSYTATKSTNITTQSVSNTTSTAFDLSWEAADDVTAYDVLVAEQSGSVESDYSIHQTVDAGTTNATITGRENGERYFVRVIARYSGADSLSTVEDDVVTEVPEPTLDLVDASTLREVVGEYTLTDNSTDGDVLVESSTDGGQSWSEVAVAEDLSATSFTHDGLSDGVERSYRVTRRTDHAEAVSDVLTATTILPAASNVGIGAEGDTAIPMSWVVEANNGSQRVEYRRSSGSAWSTYSNNLGLNVEAETVDELLTGEEYDLRVVIETANASSASATVTGQTTIPDEDAPQLGNGVEDEIAVDRETTVSNYGTVRVQTRETGASSWDSSATGWDEQVLDYDTLETIVTEREDGEEYEVRMRTETEHATGAWTDPVAITTKFPGATAATIVSPTSTSVTVEAEDNADNEDGFELEREEYIDGEWRDRRVVVDAPPNSGEGEISITDDTPAPDTEYRYRVRPYTEHTSANSNWTDSVTTPGLDGVTQEVTGASGWRVRVEHASGSVHRPRTVGSPSFQPTVNGLPQARVPVPQDEKWQSAGFERANVKAWVDGCRLPVDELVDVEDQSDRMVLVLEPSVLQGRVQREFDEEEAHLAAESVITDDAGIAASVDDPAASTRSDVEMAAADTDTGFQQELPDYPFPSDDPRTITADGTLSTHPMAVFESSHDMEVSAISGGTELSGSSDGDFYIGNEAVRFDGINEARKATLSLDYDHPEGTEAGFRILYDDAEGEGIQECSLYVDGTEVASYDTGDRPVVFQSNEPPYWFTFDLSGLDAGEHTMEIVMGDDFDDTLDNVVLDEVALVDSRYESLPQSGTVVDGVMQDFRAHPEGLAVETRDADSIEQVVAGELSSTWTATAPGQEVAISNDQGASWLTASDSGSVSGEFDSGSAQIRARFTLAAYDSGSGPVEYDSPTALDVYTLSASLDDTPLLVNKSYDASAVSVLNEIAEYGQFIWQLTWDPGTGGYRVEWTQPGQRTQELDPSVVDYSTSKRMGDMRYGTAVVKGSNRPVSGERFTAVAGTALDLYQDELLEGSEAVVDPTAGTQYERGSDYTMDYSTGAVTVLESGEMTDGEEYAIDYRYRTQGSYTSPSADPGASTLVRDFAGATDDRECGQIALNIIKFIQGPVWEVSLQIDSLPPGQLLVDEIAWPIPTQDRSVEIRSVDSGPGSVEVRGKGQSLGEVVSEIRGRVEANTQRS